MKLNTARKIVGLIILGVGLFYLASVMPPNESAGIIVVVYGIWLTIPNPE